MSKYICFECGNDSGNWVFYKSRREYKGEGFCFELNVETPYCEKCGSPIYDKEIEQEIREKANRIIREQKDIISKEEILRLVKYYGISQKYLSKVIGWGEATLPRYIKGSYSPSAANSDLLKSIKNPYVLLGKLENSIEDDGKSSREKLFNNINEIIVNLENKKGKLYKVVDWFLNNTNEEEGITHLALQKALYFVQGWSYVFNGNYMFDEECEAWTHGAVFRCVFDDFKSFKYSKLPVLKTSTTLSNYEISVLEFVKDNYIDIYSAKTLEKICHLEEPYKNARGKLSENAKSESIISKDSIESYYRKIAEKYSISSESATNVRSYINELLFG